jgi:hypothetical protein
MGWHSFRRFRNTWLRKQRVQEDHRLHWLAHQPREMSEVYSLLKRKTFWLGLPKPSVWATVFSLSNEVVPNVPNRTLFVVSRKTPATGILFNRMKETGRLAQLVRAPALQAGGRRFKSCTAHHFCHSLFEVSGTIPVDIFYRRKEISSSRFRAVARVRGSRYTW